MAKSTAKSKKFLQRRTKLEQILLAIILLLILLLLLAASFQWWPFNSPYGGYNLGTAFYTAAPSTEATTAGSSGSNGSSGNTGSSGSNGSNGTSGTTPAPAPSPAPATSSAILTFASGVNTGNTKEETSGQGSGLDEHCGLLVNSSSAGKQEVCTYTEGDKVVTVTYLNDRVVSASRSGF